jgi:hypothetical protein
MYIREHKRWEEFENANCRSDRKCYWFKIWNWDSTKSSNSRTWLILSIIKVILTPFVVIFQANSNSSTIRFFLSVSIQETQKQNSKLNTERDCPYETVRWGIPIKYHQFQKICSKNVPPEWRNTWYPWKRCHQFEKHVGWVAGFG